MKTKSLIIRTVAGASTVLLTLSTLVGCGGSSSSPASTTTEATTAEATTEATTTAASE